jgi:hypothetical protein
MVRFGNYKPSLTTSQHSLMKHLIGGAVVWLLAGYSAQTLAQAVPAQAFTRVTLHRADGSTVSNATIVWRNGMFESAGANITVPFDARVIDGGDTLHVYPGFIDGLADWGTPDIPRQQDRPERPGDPTYERAGIQPERAVRPQIKPDAAELVQSRATGFTLLAIAPKGAMLPGQVSVFHAHGEKTTASEFRSDLGIKASLTAARGAYPTTVMGVMARYRQLFYDARALQAHQATGAANARRDATLESLFPIADKRKPFYFVADDRESIRRMFSLSDELGFQTILVSGKDAHLHASELAKRNVPVLASFALPARPDTTAGKSDEETAWKTRQSEAWTASVRNIRSLLDAGVRVGFASNGLKPADLKKNIEVLLTDGGLTEAELIRIMTSQTSAILGLNTVAGDIRIGNLADMVVATGPITGSSTRIRYTVTAGDLTEIKDTPSASRGRGRMAE